jgi:CRP/FNR family transcriptional regulator, anaerobic regulatory protein
LASSLQSFFSPLRFVGHFERACPPSGSRSLLTIIEMLRGQRHINTKRDHARAFFIVKVGEIMRATPTVAEDKLPDSGRIVVGRSPSSEAQELSDDRAHLQSQFLLLGYENYVPANETIWNGEEEKRSCAIVLSGVGRCVHFLEDGRRQILRFVFPGDFLSSASGPVTFSFESVSPLHLVTIPCARVDCVCADSLALKTGIEDGLRSEVSDYQQHVILLAQTRAVERMVGFLNMLAQRSGAGGQDPTHIPMCRRDMADYLGLTIETVSRVLSRLKREGAIQLPSANVVSLHTIEARGTPSPDRID